MSNTPARMLTATVMTPAMATNKGVTMTAQNTATALHGPVLVVMYGPLRPVFSAPCMDLSTFAGFFLNGVGPGAVYFDGHISGSGHGAGRKAQVHLVYPEITRQSELLDEFPARNGVENHAPGRVILRAAVGDLKSNAVVTRTGQEAVQSDVPGVARQRDAGGKNKQGQRQP